MKRLQPSDMKQFKLLGIPWFRRKEYAPAIAIMADRDQLYPTYEEWLPIAQARLKQLQAQNRRCKKVFLEVAPFEAFCEEQGIARDAHARALYAVAVASGRVKQG